MLKEKETFLRRFLIVFDGLLFGVSYLLSYYLRLHIHQIYRGDLFKDVRIIEYNTPAFSEYLVILLIIAPVWCWVLYLNGMYRSLRTKKLYEVIWIPLKSSAYTYIVFGMVVFLLNFKNISRLFLLILITLSLAAITLEKLLIFAVMHSVRRKGMNYRRVLVVGTGMRAAGFIHRIQKHPEWGIVLVGAINDEPGRKCSDIGNVKILGDLNAISDILHENPIDEVIFIVPRLRLNHIENAIRACEIEGIKATLAIDLYNLNIAKPRFTELDGTPLLTFETTVAREWQLFIKRSADVMLSFLAIIILSPVLLTIALLVKMTSKGPVLYKQERVGLNGRKFILSKFRTMYKDADMRKEALKSYNEMDGPVFKIKNDPRITPLGKVLRRLSLDELPQFFHVFVGHMSLIGPRPPIPAEVAQYKCWQRRRLSMRPGLTCLWQVSGRNKLDFNKWMELDLKYLDNWSLMMDLKIMVRTVPVVLFGIGAY